MRSPRTRSSGLVRCGLAIVALAALAASCASPTQLARKSTRALAAGDTGKAWQFAERAMKKDPRLPVARDAMTAAAERAIPDWERRVRSLAASDTVAAAKLAVEFGAVRSELTAWTLPVPVDSTYLGDELLIRDRGAALLYRRAAGEMRAHRPRDAYRDFNTVNQIEPGFRHVEQRIERAFDAALVRIAIVPFDDDARVPGLAADLADEIHDHLVAAMPEKKYPFVRFLPRNVVAAQLAQSGSDAPLGREGALHLGRAIGAQRVVWGRIDGFDSDTHTDTWTDVVYRRTASRDTSSREKVRWDPVDFTSVRRVRTVSVSWHFEVIDTDDETVLAKRDGTEHVTASTVWTTFDPEGDPAQYAFAPPGWKKNRAGEWNSAQNRWKSHYGDWSPSGFFGAARAGRGHPHYQRDDRDRFFHSGHPVFMDDLPPREDLAYEALRSVDVRVEDALKALEAQAAAK